MTAAHRLESDVIALRKYLDGMQLDGPLHTLLVGMINALSNYAHEMRQRERSDSK